MDQDIKISKLCNAFQSNAEAKDISIGVSGFSIPINPTIDNYKKKHGGLWVGGRMFVTNEEIIFNQNAINKVLHKSDNGFSINLSDVTSVEHIFGFFTGIIVILTKDSVYKIRSYGAKKVAEQINELINS